MRCARIAWVGGRRPSRRAAPDSCSPRSAVGATSVATGFPDRASSRLKPLPQGLRWPVKKARACERSRRLSLAASLQNGEGARRGMTPVGAASAATGAFGEFVSRLKPLLQGVRGASCRCTNPCSDRGALHRRFPPRSPQKKAPGRCRARCRAGDWSGYFPIQPSSRSENSSACSSSWARMLSRMRLVVVSLSPMKLIISR